MSRMENMKSALAGAVETYRSKIEMSQKEGRIPQDYSLGFVNGLIFCEHKINMRCGAPKYYDRTTSIGALPKPVVLGFGGIQGEDMIRLEILETLLLACRNKDSARMQECVQKYDKLKESLSSNPPGETL